jgi:hypothetical protein
VERRKPKQIYSIHKYLHFDNNSNNKLPPPEGKRIFYHISPGIPPEKKEWE